MSDPEVLHSADYVRPRPRLLDLFCGSGGASMGYYRAGFDVVGVDINPMPRYPFEFVQADAVDYPLDGFEAIHASPPCQSYSRAMRHFAAPQPMLIDVMRERLVGTGLPWVIENVPGAPMLTQMGLFKVHGVVLCGTHFGLRIYRHRIFESSVPIPQPTCSHREPAMNPHNQAGRDRIYAEFGRQDPDPIWNEEMGVPWMTKYDGREAIPPAYTEHIGRALLAFEDERHRLLGDSQLARDLGAAHA